MTLPPRFVDLKRSIASSYPDFEARATTAWREIITELDKVTKVIKEEGSNVGISLMLIGLQHIYEGVLYIYWFYFSRLQYVPQINFNSLDSIPQDEIEKIKRRGSVLIRDVVDDAQAVEWKDELKEFVKVNDVEGIHKFKN
jgi:hypothetical protein